MRVLLDEPLRQRADQMPRPIIQYSAVPSLSKAIRVCTFLASLASPLAESQAAFASPPLCLATALPTLVRAAGTAEAVADIHITCRIADAYPLESIPSIIRISLAAPLSPIREFRSTSLRTATLTPQLILESHDPSDIVSLGGPATTSSFAVQWSDLVSQLAAHSSPPCTTCRESYSFVARGIRVDAAQLTGSAPTFRIAVPVSASVSVLNTDGQQLGLSDVIVAHVLPAIAIHTRVPALTVPCDADAGSSAILLHLAEGAAGFLNSSSVGPSLPHSRSKDDPISIMLSLRNIPRGVKLTFPSSISSEQRLEDTTRSQSAAASLVHIAESTQGTATAIYTIIFSSPSIVETLAIPIHVQRDLSSIAADDFDSLLDISVTLINALDDNDPPSQHPASHFASGPHATTTVRLFSACWTHLVFPLVKSASNYETVLTLSRPALDGSPGLDTLCAVRLGTARNPTARHGEETTLAVSLPSGGQEHVSIFHPLPNSQAFGVANFQGFAVASCPSPGIIGSAAIVQDDPEGSGSTSQYTYYAIPLDKTLARSHAPAQPSCSQSRSL